MKKWKKLIFSIMLVSHSIFAAPQVIDKISAIVNNEAILESDVDNFMKFIKFVAKQTNQKLPKEDVLRYQILEHLILNQIILQIGQKIGINISEDQIDQNFFKKNDIKSNQIPIQLNYPNLNYSIYKNQIQKEILISEIKNKEVYRRIMILPQEIENLAKEIFNQNNSKTQFNLTQIIIPLPENLTLNQLNKAERQAISLVERARNGSNFSKLAMGYLSNKKNIKVKKTGWIYIEEIPYNFAKEIKTAKKGDIFGPIRSNIGFHIIKVNDIKKQEQKIFTTEVHIRHIFLKPSFFLTDNQARIRLEKIATDIKNGKVSFANMAKRFSQDLSSANKGGDLGWITNIYDSNIQSTLTKMKKGQISPPIHSSFGWHLIELLDIRNVDKTDLAQKDQAYQILFDQKFSEESENWMQEQRANAYVKIISN